MQLVSWALFVRFEFETQELAIYGEMIEEMIVVEEIKIPGKHTETQKENLIRRVPCPLKLQIAKD